MGTTITATRSSGEFSFEILFWLKTSEMMVDPRQFHNSQLKGLLETKANLNA
jgi:hypothetical protein